jgi:DNA repair protein RadC
LKYTLHRSPADAKVAAGLNGHQHPSQDVSPTWEDMEVTKRLADCGKILGIEVLDHVIVNAAADFYSMREKGHL